MAMVVSGSRIRECRHAMGLSQQQLGGKEMSRAFISLIEQNKAQPSRRNLEVIAERLGKAPEYFLSAETGEDMRAVALLEKTAIRLVQERNWQAALQHTESALHLVKRLGEPHSELRLRMTAAYCHLFSGDYEMALEQYEALAETCKTLNEREALVEVYYRLGMTHQVLEDYQSARRYYIKAVQRSQDKKTLAEKGASSLVNLGTVCCLLGDLDSAIRAFEEAIRSILPSEVPNVYADACSGLSICLRKAKRLEEARTWAQKAISAFDMTNPADAVNARHAMAEICLEMGEITETLPLLYQCLDAYQRMGEVRRQAYVLETLAAYFLRVNEYERAAGVCQEGLTLLDSADDGVLRGIFYRHAGEAQLALGNCERSRELLRFSLDLLRRMKVSAEVERTSSLLQRISTETRP